MTFALPQIKAPRSMTARLIGGHVEPPVGEGGVQQRFLSVGSSKYAVDVKYPPMTFTDACALVGALLRAQREEVTMKWHQPGFVIGNPGPRTAGAVSSANATVLNVAGAAGYVASALQFFNVVGADGRRYLHAFTQANELPGATIIAPALRVDVEVGTELDLATPVIQGFVQGRETPWTVDEARHFGVAFTIMERK